MLCITSDIWQDMKSSCLYYDEYQHTDQLDLMVLKVLPNINYSTISNKARGSAELAAMQTDTAINTQISHFFSGWKGGINKISFASHLTGYWYPALHEVTWSYSAGWNRQCKFSCAVQLCIDSCEDTEGNQEVSWWLKF